jgi:hypothetical protein
VPVASDENETVVSREMALAHRPSLEDPTKLASGQFHPRYVDWLTRPSIETNPWLHGTFETLVERLPHTADDKLDCAPVRAALGPRWKDLILGEHLGAKAATWRRFAALIDLSEPELMAHVERARAAKDEREAMLRNCCHFPYRLQSWQQVQGRVPCPGCGHPWLELDSDDAQREFGESHGKCGAGRSGFSDCRQHCGRCCGVPPINPEVRQRVFDMLQESARRRAADEQAHAKRERSERDVGQRMQRREAEIAVLERRLELLRAKQKADESETLREAQTPSGRG